MRSARLERRIRQSAVTVAIVLAACGVTPALAGANLLANPDFPQAQVLPWQVDMYGSMDWSSNDVHGTSGSGSMRVVDDRNFYFPFVNSECVPVAGDAPIDATASFRGVANIDAAATVHYRISLWSSTDCSAGWLAELKSTAVKPGTSWFAIPLAGTAPAGARSMRMRIGVSTGTSEGRFLTVEVDAISLSHAGSLPDPVVFRDGFEGGLGGWSQTSGN